MTQDFDAPYEESRDPHPSGDAPGASSWAGSQAPPAGDNDNTASAQAIPNPIPITIHCTHSADNGSPRKRSGFLGGCLGWLLRTVMTCFIILLLFSALWNMDGFSGAMIEEDYQSGDPAQTIALVELNDTIDMDTAYLFRDKLTKAVDDDHVRAVIVLINSPGGAVVPSAMIEHWISRFRVDQDKPIYAVIEQVGASGAYWAASAAQKIYAQSNAMVGSIGVIYISMVVQQGLEEKLGIDPIVITSSRSPFKDRGSPFRMPTETEKADIREDLDTVHGRFVSVISRNRNIPEPEAWTLADGEVFDGIEAQDRHLVDAVGYLEDAVSDLSDILGLDNPRVVYYERPPQLSDFLTCAAQSRQPFDVHMRQAMDTLISRPRIFRPLDRPIVPVSFFMEQYDNGQSIG